MNAITNSKIKEGMRLNNEQIAGQKRTQIMRDAEKMIDSLIPKNPLPLGRFIAGAIGGFVLLFTKLFIIGILCFIVGIIGIIVAVNIKKYNDHLIERKAEIRHQAEEDVKQAYIDADNRTRQEIAAYEHDVEIYAKKTQSNADSLSPMVEHSIKMFQRMISHADAGAHMRFVEANLVYVVMNDGIRYSYSSTYTNPQDDFNFNIQRYRGLNSPAECEGLAQTLARLIVAGMKKNYPPNSINITLTHNDAEVILHFKGANKNFIPARDII